MGFDRILSTAARQQREIVTETAPKEVHFEATADDSYAIILSDNVHTRTAELDNVKAWANMNNLRLNLAKCAEIIFYDSRRKRQPSPLPNVPRVQSLKILGVTFSSKLSVVEHVCNIIRSSAQTCHALRLLRAHGMVNASLQVVCRAIITAKLTYAASLRVRGGVSPPRLTVNA